MCNSILYYNALKNAIYHLLFFNLLLLSTLVPANTIIPRESQLQAVFLMRFSSFISWPKIAFMESNSPFKLCVFGEHSFGDNLNIAIREEYYDEHPIQTLYTANIDDLSQCHTLFIGHVPSYQLKQLLQQVENKPILTVSANKQFIKMGGMIEFYTQQNRVRFMIHPQRIKDLQLAVNANLLRVGDVVQ